MNNYKNGKERKDMEGYGKERKDIFKCSRLFAI